MCQARIAAALKQSKQNSYEANCLEDDMSDIETIRDIYLPVENAASAASANDDSIEQALDFEPGNKREKKKRKIKSTKFVYRRSFLYTSLFSR